MRKIKKRTPHLSSSWLHRFMGIMIVLLSYLTVFAQTSTSVSVNVGKTKTCYLPTSITGLKNLRTTYVAVSPSYADISSHSKTSVTIKGIKKTSTPVIVRCDYYFTNANNLQGHKAYDFKVTVIDNTPTPPTPVYPQNITLSSYSESMNVGDTKKLTVSISPYNVDQSVSWTSQNRTIAYVDSRNILYAVGTGTTKVTAWTSNGLSASCTVTVKPIKPQSITISSSINMVVGESTPLTYTVTPTNANVNSLRWVTGDESVATITSSNTIKALKQGKTTLRCVVNESVESNEAQITVIKPTLALKSNIESGSYPKGTKITLEADNPNAQILYTTNGTRPAKSNSTSVLYTSPIILEQSMAIKAIAYHEDYAHSEMLELNLDMIPEESPTPILSIDYTISDGDCIENILKNESGYNHIWVRTEKYGWKGSAYNKSNYIADAMLYLPEMDLTNYQKASLTINQAINFAKGKALDYLSVEAVAFDSKTGKEKTYKLTDFNVPDIDSWNFADYSLDLSLFCGNKVKLAFHYTSDADICCTWDIRNLKIEGVKNTTGIGVLTNDNNNCKDIDFSKPYKMFSTDGKIISSVTGYKGVIIIRQNNVMKKIVMK